VLIVGFSGGGALCREDRPKDRRDVVLSTIMWPKRPGYG